MLRLYYRTFLTYFSINRFFKDCRNELNFSLSVIILELSYINCEEIFFLKCLLFQSWTFISIDFFEVSSDKDSYILLRDFIISQVFFDLLWLPVCSLPLFAELSLACSCLWNLKLLICDFCWLNLQALLCVCIYIYINPVLIFPAMPFSWLVDQHDLRIYLYFEIPILHFKILFKY